MQNCRSTVCTLGAALGLAGGAPGGDDDFQKLSGPERIAAARRNHAAAARQICADAQVPYPPARFFLRAFKATGELEAWGAGRDGKMRLIRTYALTARSGAPGPKRFQGDRQVPEGVYRVAVWNPESRFHLSLGLNYPNAADRARAGEAAPGGEIYIHGKAVSVGCLPVGDAEIEELFILALDVKEAGGRSIPVHIFPARMMGADWESLRDAHPEHAPFWAQLAPIFEAFERRRRIPAVTISDAGEYQLVERP